MWVMPQNEATPLPVRYREDGRGTRLTNYFGDLEQQLDGPQAFLVDLTDIPGAVVRPHFHTVRQFQVIVAGNGRLGKRPVPPISFHYADPYTPYGPIVGDESGVAFFTLRAQADLGIYYMPGSRDQMKRKAGRNVARVVPDAPSGEDAPVLETLVEPHADGLAAFRLRPGREERTAGPDPAGSGGQYYLVMHGSLRHEDRELPERSLLFVEPGDGAPALTAGPDGADVLVLQFPVETASQ